MLLKNNNNTIKKKNSKIIIHIIIIIKNVTPMNMYINQIDIMVTKII